MTAIVFFGTHQFAATILEGVIKLGIADVKRVLTQPDRPVGRSQKNQASPVKTTAQTYGIPVEQPENLKNYKLQTQDCKLGIVAQYGLIIPKNLLNAFPWGVINVHTSLLPKYRGASPIQAAIMHGDATTGVTIMQMDEGLDTGPILLQKIIPIGPDDTTPEVESRLAELAVDALEEAIPAYLAGVLSPVAQNHASMSICKKLTREEGLVDWTRTAHDIYNQYRALQPWPGVWTMWRNKRLKLLRLIPVSAITPTKLVQVKNNHLLIGCGQGSIEVTELQIEGARPQDAKNFLHGHQIINGALLR